MIDSPYLLGSLLLSLGLFLLNCQGSESGTAHPKEEPAWIPPDHPQLLTTGRFWREPTGKRHFAWSGSRIQARFTGDSVRLHLHHLPAGVPTYAPDTNYYRVQLDDRPGFVLAATPEDSSFLLARGLGAGPHQLDLFRLTEARLGVGVFGGLSLAPGGELLPMSPDPAPLFEFIGNSITCGYGNAGEGPECDFDPADQNGWEAFGARAARACGARYRAICYSGRGVYQNYDRSRSGTLPQLYELAFPALEAPSWPHEGPSPELIVLNLGTNDFAHLNPPQEAFLGHYETFVRKLRNLHPEAEVILLTGPMLNNQPSRQPLRTLKVYLDALQARLQQQGDLRIHRFDLSPQGKLGYGCRWHPNLAQHALNAQELASFIQQTLGYPHHSPSSPL
jgi:hypothetical protein